ncbi:MAG TPA: transglycosylase SLT domain-containing protein, partial [Sphingomicrobium sp.]
MPRVPIEQNRVGIAEVTGAKLQAADTSGTGLQAVGRGMQEIGGATVQFAQVKDQQERLYDDAAAKQGWNAYAEGSRSLLRMGDGAFYTQEGFNAGNALKPTEQALTKLRDDVRGTLKTERQRQMYDQAIGERYGVDVAGIHEYAGKQFKVEQNRQSEGVKINSANDALDHVDDPVMFGEYVATGVKAIDAQATAQGWAPETAKAAKANYVSSIHLRVADQRQTSDPVAASAYAHEHRDEMTFDDRAKLERSLREPLTERAAVAILDAYPGAAAGVTPATPQPVPGGGTPMARMVAITAHSESGNRDFVNGGVITSPAGARGRMQVMPGTQRDPGFGVRPARDGSMEELARVGRDYLAAMTKRYPGDPAKAWAAYNAGPGNAEKGTGLAGGMKRAAAAGQPGNWLAYMPKETQDYVRKNVAMLGGAGAPSAAAGYTPAKDDLGAIYAYIEGQNLPFDVKKAAMAEADRRVARSDRLVERAEREASDAALTQIEALGDNFTSMNQIAADVRRRLSPEARIRLGERAEQNAMPKPIDANGDAVVNMHQLANLDPEAFKKKDLRLYRANMTPAEYDQLATLQSSMIAKPSGSAEISHSAIWKQISFYGRDLGVDMGPKAKGETDEKFKQRRGEGMALFSVMQNYLRTLTEGKRQPTD